MAVPHGQNLYGDEASNITFSKGSLTALRFSNRYRPDVFTDLGSFSEPGLLYILTSNEDRQTSWHSTMWTLQMRFTAGVVYLNFRSETHVRKGRSALWLRAEGWTLEKEMASTFSSGIPPRGHPVRGPYSGPVYSKYFPLGSKCKLRGSNNCEPRRTVRGAMTFPSPPPVCPTY